MGLFYNNMICRNIGCISKSQQTKICDSCAAIAGAGGVGGLVAERLARFGVGSFRISDPGVFEESNLNRQYGSNKDTLGMNKARTISNELRMINQEVETYADEKGINSQEDADKFVHGASIVVDAMDYPLFKESIYLQRAARTAGVYYMFSSSFGFGSIVVIFEPGGYTLEQYNGLEPGADLAAINSKNIAEKTACPKLPDYLWENLDTQAVTKMVLGETPVSVNSIGVGLNCIMVANEVVNCLLQRMPVVVSPNFIYLDLLERSFKIMGPDY